MLIYLQLTIYSFHDTDIDIVTTSRSGVRIRIHSVSIVSFVVLIASLFDLLFLLEICFVRDSVKELESAFSALKPMDLSGPRPSL